MGEALTITRVPLDRVQVKLIIHAVERVTIPGKDEILKTLRRAERRMDPSVPHGKGD
jgi:hypothetical protein